MIKAVIFDFDGTLAPLLLNFDRMRVEIEMLARQYVSDQEVERLRQLYVIEMIYEVEKVAQDKEAAFRRAAFDRLGDLEVAASKGNAPTPTRTRSSLLCARVV